MTVTIRNLCTSLLITVLLAIMGCKTVEPSVSDKIKPDSRDSSRAQKEEDRASALQTLLNSSRSSLRDVYSTQRHDMPEQFLKKDSVDESINSNPFDGYRIQIISTRSMQTADSVAGSFRIWADTTITGYNARVYVSFRQPYYKVHVGDFQRRNRANSFSQLLKKRYPGAWVVHDRIDPDSVPADTARFSLQKVNADSNGSPLKEVPTDSL